VSNLPVDNLFSGLDELFKKTFEDIEGPGGWQENQYQFEDISKFETNTFKVFVQDYQVFRL
jgi:regulatory protein YycH of two-component signal transduction system YycFG